MQHIIQHYGQIPFFLSYRASFFIRSRYEKKTDFFMKSVFY
ncbi:hypothetical protein HS9_01484 [Bacillus velezensis]|nr:hypothetical protein HS9_01484 [Bacillus velezensis]